MKKIISASLALLMAANMTAVPTLAAKDDTVLITSAPAVRDYTKAEKIASELKKLGIFKGVSDTDFDLDRAPTRVEAVVMLIRFLGKEAEALGGTWEHPFTDVPEWADNYIGYAYKNGLTNGISKTEFGTGDANAAMFITFTLRALGYSDKENGDFTWDAPFALAYEAKVLSADIELENFMRADVVITAYNALGAKLKGSEETLADYLGSEHVFTSEQYNSMKLAIEGEGVKKYNYLTDFTNYTVSDGLDENGFFEGVKASDYVDLGDFKNLDLPLDILTVNDEEINAEIETLLSQHEGYSELTDELAKMYGFDSADELLADIEKWLYDNKKSEIIVAIAENAQFREIPDSMVEYILNLVIYSYMAPAASYGMTLEEFAVSILGCESFDAFIELQTVDAIEDVKYYLVYQAIAEAEGITVTDEDITAVGYEEDIDLYGKPFVKLTVLVEYKIPDLVVKIYSEKKPVEKKYDYRTDFTDYTMSEGIDDNGYISGIRALDYVELGNYDKLPGAKELLAVSEKELELAIASYLGNEVEYEKITDRAVVIGDTVAIEVSAVFEDENAEDVVPDAMEMNTDPAMISAEVSEIEEMLEYMGYEISVDWIRKVYADFTDAMVGAKPGDTVNMDFVYSKDVVDFMLFTDESLTEDEANEMLDKSVTCEIKINHIVGSPILPEIDDELAAKYGFESKDEFIENVNGMLVLSKQNALLMKIVDGITVKEVPDAVMELFINQSLYAFSKYADELDTTVEALMAYIGAASIDEYVLLVEEEICAEAEVALMLQALAEAGNVTVTDEDIIVYDLQGYVEEYGMPYAKMNYLSIAVQEYLLGLYK